MCVYSWTLPVAGLVPVVLQCDLRSGMVTSLASPLLIRMLRLSRGFGFHETVSAHSTVVPGQLLTHTVLIQKDSGDCGHCHHVE